MNILRLLSTIFLFGVAFTASAENKKDFPDSNKELFVTATYSMKVLCENPPGYDADSIIVFKVIRNTYFTGVIFPKEKGVGAKGISPTRYTLDAFEVSKTEQLLKQNIKKLNQLLRKREHFRLKEEQIPYLNYDDLKAFFRQYVGYKLGNGDIIVQMTFERNHSGDYLLEEFRNHTDAYESYDFFCLDVNLTKQQITLPQGFVY